MRIQFSLPVWGIESETGYKPMTTFWQDFSIADKFGEKAVEDTFKRAFNEWRTDYKYLTELVMVLNHKIWQHFRQNEPNESRSNRLAKVYNDLWQKAQNYGYDHLKGEKLNYFYNTLD